MRWILRDPYAIDHTMARDFQTGKYRPCVSSQYPRRNGRTPSDRNQQCRKNATLAEYAQFVRRCLFHSRCSNCGKNGGGSVKETLSKRRQTTAEREVLCETSITAQFLRPRPAGTHEAFRQQKAATLAFQVSQSKARAQQRGSSPGSNFNGANWFVYAARAG